MGNCFSDSVQTTADVGNVNQGTASQMQREADEAMALLSGSMAYSAWVSNMRATWALLKSQLKSWRRFPRRWRCV